MFDAGAIMAHLDLDTRLFDTKLKDAESRVAAEERKTHKIKIAAEFDNASTSKARKAFADLDNMISREAMQRLRSSPQGSVLGALNALFSPHPVTGAPTAQQAFQQGLLGKIVSPQASTGAGGGSTAGQILTGNGAPGSGRQVINITQTGGSGSTSAETAADTQVSKDLKDATGAMKDSASASRQTDADLQDATAAMRESSARSGNLFSRLGDLFRGGGGGGGGGGTLLGGLAGAAAGKSAGQLAAGLAGGIGPGILGVSAKAGSIIGLGGSVLGALPALFGGLSPLLAAAPGLAGIGALAAGSIKQVSPILQAQQAAQQALSAATTPAQVQAAQQQLQGVNQQVSQLSPALKSVFNSINNIENAWQALSGSFAPLIAKALNSVSGLFRSLLPDLNQFFAASGTLLGPLIGGLGDIAKQLLPQFSDAIRAAAPVLRPLLDGLGSLVSNIFPGLIALVKASSPAVKALSDVFGTLGKDLGSMLGDFAPVLNQSGVLLKALFDLIGGLLPVIAKLAGVFAQALAPVFLQFAGVIKSLLPFLTVIGKVLGALASAVLGDLVSAFSALAQLLVGVAPALGAFAKAISGVFNVLENTGTFAILGDAIESLVPSLVKLVNTILRGLVPILPPVIQFIGQLSSMLAGALASAISAVLPPLTTLAGAVLRAIAVILPVVLPIITKLFSLFTGAVVTAISGIATALADIINAIPPKVLTGIVIGVLAIVGAVKAWSIAQGVLDTVLAANPIGAILLAVVALGVGIVELVKHWDTVWADIKSVAEDAWRFVWNGFGKFLLPLLGPAGLIALGAIEMYQHWNQICGLVKQAGQNLWNWLWADFGQKIFNFFTRTIPGWWGTFINATNNDLITPLKNAFTDVYNWIWNDFGAKINTFLTSTLPGWFKTAVSNVGNFWDKIKGTVEAPVGFVINTVIGGIANVFDTITHAIGLGNPVPKPPYVGFAGGGAIGKVLVGHGPTDDDVLARVSRDETVVSAAHSKILAPWFAAVGVPGYASGGNPNPIPGSQGGHLTGGGTPPPPSPGGLGKIGDIGKIIAAIATGNSTALTNAFDNLLGLKSGAGGTLGLILATMPKKLVGDAVNWIMSSGFGNATGQEILNYAKTFVGAVPYVWGGDTPAGWDCSGMVSYILDHFHLFNGRTTAAGLQSWAKKVDAPAPGEMVFFGNPAYHVGIVDTNALMVSALGKQWGTTISSLAGNSGFGVPPKGWGAAGGGPPGGPTSSGYWVNVGRMMAAQSPYFWTGSEFLALDELWTKESGWNPNAQNPLSGAAGIPQDITGNFHGGGVGQIAWGLNYILHRYGSPAAAWGHEVADNWYGNGGLIAEPVIGFGTQTGQGYVFGEKGAEWVTPVGSGKKSQIADTLILQLPEGTSVASALSQLKFFMQAAQMGGYANVRP